MAIQRPQPIIDQVVSLLRQRVRDGDYGPDYRLPSENTLAVELGVSRTTIRTALSALASEKLIIRKQGDGTYVNTRFLDVTTRFGMIWEYTNMIEDDGSVASIKALNINQRSPLAEEATALELNLSEEVLSIERLFYSDETPVIFSTNVIPESQLCQELTLEQVEEPLPDFFHKFCSQEEFTYGISEISSLAATEEIAELLLIKGGDPVLRFSEVFFNANDRPLVYAINYFNDKKIPLKVARSFS
jgi:GntR family transcriptional regulator